MPTYNPISSKNKTKQRNFKKLRYNKIFFRKQRLNCTERKTKGKYFWMEAWLSRKNWKGYIYGKSK